MRSVIASRIKATALVAGSVMALGLAGAVMVLGIAGGVRSAAPDPLTAEYAALGHVTIDAANAPEALTAVSSEQAATIAQQEVGAGHPVASIHHGWAGQYVNSPVRSVWLVSFTDVPVPNVGPIAKAQAVGPSILTAVIVDDSTGEVLRTFSIGP